MYGDRQRGLSFCGTAGERGGRREARVRVTEEIREAIIAYISINGQTTLKSIADHIHREHGTRLSTSTLSRVLDGQQYTLKLARAVPVSWNTAANKAARREYAEWFTVHGVAAHCVFIDECGINVWTRRTQGRAVRGHRAIRQVHGQRGKNFTIILAISPRHGLCHFMTINGSATK